MMVCLLVLNWRAMAEIHGELDSILSVLDLGVAGIRYHAGSVLKSEVFEADEFE